MPAARASGRGKIPRILMNGQAAAYSSRCRITKRDGTTVKNYLSNRPQSRGVRGLPCEPLCPPVVKDFRDHQKALLRRFLRPFRQRAQKRIRRPRRRIDLSRQRRPERHHASVKLTRAVLVLL